VTHARRALGASGEELVAEWYEARGYRVLDRNWRYQRGELDIVASRGALVVFCEVKTRAGGAFGGGHEAVTWRKQRKLRQLAELFLAGLRVAPAAVRFDVASVLARPGVRPAVEVFEDAF